MNDLDSKGAPQILERTVIVIAWSTVLTGFVQMLKPAPIMRLIGARNTAGGQHLFATIGMFMIVVGGLLLQTILFERRASRLVMGWASIQKFGAAVAVLIGVVRGIFSPLALVVAGFDFVSGILIALLRPGRPDLGEN